MMPALLPHEFFAAVVLVGMLLLLLVYIPVQVASKRRRMRRRHLNIVCRICGYRFLRRDAEATCPHCAARNR